MQIAMPNIMTTTYEQLMYFILHRCIGSNYVILGFIKRNIK